MSYSHFHEELDRLLVEPEEETKQRRHERIAAIRHIMRDPDCSTGILRRIVQCFLPRWEDRFGQDAGQVLATAALQSGLPPELLARISYFAPRAVGRNPAAPLLALEAPDAIAGLSTNARLRLLRYGDAPTSLVKAVAATAPEEDAEVREQARLHVALTGEATPEEWRAEVAAYWRQHAAESNGCRQYVYAEFAVLGILPDWGAGEGSEEWLRQGRKRLLRAGDAATPSREREAMAWDDPFWVVRIAALLNPAVPLKDRAQRIGSGTLHDPVNYLLESTLLDMWRHGEFVSPVHVRDQCRRALLRMAV